MGKKPDYRKKIIQCLSENTLGLTITDISNSLGISRNTVYRYLDLLEKEGEVFKKQVGVYYLYFSDERNLLSKQLVLSFFKGLLVNFKRVFPNKENLFKEFGRNIADSMDFSISHKDIEYLKKIITKPDKTVLEVIMKYFPLFNVLNDDITIDDIKINKKENKAIITFIDSHMMESGDDYIYYFYLLTGMIEKKLSEYADKEIRLEIVDYKIKEVKDSNFIKFSFGFDIALPQMEIEKIDDIIIPESDFIDIELIKMNLKPITFIYLIRGCIFKEKILFLIENEFFHSHLLNFLKFIFKDTFEINISVEKLAVYDTNKDFFSNYLAFSDNVIYKDKNKVLNSKAIKIEKILVQKFLSNYNPKSSLFLLKREIKKAYILANELSIKIDTLKPKEKEENIDSKVLLKDLEKTYNTKVSLPYMDFLIEIVENYFKVPIPKMWKFFLYRP